MVGARSTLACKVLLPTGILPLCCNCRQSQAHLCLQVPTAPQIWSAYRGEVCCIQVKCRDKVDAATRRLILTDPTTLFGKVYTYLCGVNPLSTLPLLSRAQVPFNMAPASTESGRSAVVAVTGMLGAYLYLVLPLFLGLRFLYYRYNSPLRRYPGPLLASGSRAWKGMRG